MKAQCVFAAGVAILVSTGYPLPAFPGAEGWGGQTPGGRGGRVISVTNTQSAGPGSLQAAIRSAGPRIVVFRVSGVIDLQPSGQWYLQESNSNLTIAGQTSPGGVTLKASAGGSSILFNYSTPFHDNIFRFLRFRARSHNSDALSLLHGYQSIIDHCDFSGARDETLDLSDGHDLTVQWSTISNSSFCGQCQTYGFLISNYGYNGQHVSIHHNLMANHIFRFPEVTWEGTPAFPPDSGRWDYRNNVLYNGERYFFMAYQFSSPAKSVQINIVGNTFKAGPQSPPNGNFDADWFYSMNHLDDHLLGFEKDNVMIAKDGTRNTTTVGNRLAYKSSNPIAVPPVVTQSADSAFDLVLDRAGAMPKDSMNIRTTTEVRTATGQYGRDDDPLITTGPAAPADADSDGMPDFWEDDMGLNKNSASDNNQDKDGDGYTNIEEYINDLAQAHVCRDYENPVYPIPYNWTDYNPACCKSLAVEGGLPANVDKTHAIQVSPNPFFGGLLNIRLPSRRGEIRILDVQGRRMRTLSVVKSLQWDGRDKDGRRVSRGLYQLYWVEYGKISGRRQIVVLK